MCKDQVIFILALKSAQTILLLPVRREVSSSDRAYVNVRKGRGGCGSSSVGRQGRSQNLNISPGCFSDRTIMHEFIHAIGFYHEQSRPDRDRYVTIVTENISPSNRYNFRLRSNDLTFNVPYDGLSIMHYTSKAFSRNGKDTIVSKVNNAIINLNHMKETCFFRTTKKHTHLNMYRVQKGNLRTTNFRFPTKPMKR